MGESPGLVFSGVGEDRCVSRVPNSDESGGTFGVRSVRGFHIYSSLRSPYLFSRTGRVSHRDRRAGGSVCFSYDQRIRSHCRPGGRDVHRLSGV